MSLIYKHTTKNGTCQCFAVNDYISAWIDRSPTTFNFIIGHHASRFGAGLEEARANGISWTWTELDALHQVMEGLEQISKNVLEQARSSEKIMVGEGKEMQVLFNKMYGRKVQITEGDKYVRLPLFLFKSMYHSLGKQGSFVF